MPRIFSTSRIGGAGRDSDTDLQFNLAKSDQVVLAFRNDLEQARRDSLSRIKFFFSLGVSRGDVSLFERKRGEIMNGDKPLISVDGLHQ